MFLRAESKTVDVDSAIRGAGVVLVRLDHIEVGTLTLRETVLSIELELGRNARILTPTVHIEGGLGQHEGAGIRDKGSQVVLALGKRGEEGTIRRPVTTGSRVTGRGILSTSHIEETGTGDEGAFSSRRSECVDGIRESINGIGVVERLGPKGVEKNGSRCQRRAVVNIGIGLHNPDQLLAGVIEVELDLVTGTSHTLIAGKLHLLEKVFVGVLGHLAALVRVQEDIVDVEGGSHKGLLVSEGRRHGSSGVSGEGAHRPQALTDGANVEVDLDLVVLEGDQREGKSRVAVEPEHQRDVKGGLRESVTGSAHLVDRASGGAGTRDTSKSRIGDVGELGGVSDHLEVSALLLGGHGELVPDVHPITVLAINALASNLDLNLGDELLTDVVEPTGIVGHRLVDLGESHLEVGAVSQISVTGDGAGNTATEICLTREGLLDRLHREVGMASVRHLPESDLRGSSKEDILGAIGDELHKTTSHQKSIFIYYAEIIIWEK